MVDPSRAPLVTSPSASWWVAPQVPWLGVSPSGWEYGWSGSVAPAKRLVGRLTVLGLQLVRELVLGGL